MRSLLGSIVGRSPVPYTGSNGSGSVLSRLGSYGRGDRGTHLAAMGASATLFSVVNRTSTSTAKEQWHLHRLRQSADSICPICECEGVALVDRHPALSVLEKPNNFYTRQELFESGQQHVDLTGEGWTVIYRMGQVPYELWNVRPDRITVVENAANFLLGYIYTDPDGKEHPIRKEDMLSIRMPDPSNPYRGMGPVATLLDQIGSSKLAAEYQRHFFANGARPGAIVKLSRRMSDTEFEQLVERYNYNHKGIANANRTAFLEDGDFIDVKPYTLADMQFVESANLNRDTILLAYGMSKFAVGVVEDVNRATAEASKAWFGETITVPRLDRWKGMLNNDFLPQFPGFGFDLEFVYSNPVPADREADREDKKTATRIYIDLIKAGVDPVEAAAYAGVPPMTIRTEATQREEVTV
jgi:HK97 family phage portal protein